LNWFKRANKNESEKSENKSPPNKEELKIKIENPDSISKKRELVEQEYNEVVRDLMISKKELKNIMQDIQKSNSEYTDLVSKIKSTRSDMYTANT